MTNSTLDQVRARTAAFVAERAAEIAAMPAVPGGDPERVLAELEAVLVESGAIDAPAETMKPLDLCGYAIDRAESLHALGTKSDAELHTLAAHFRRVAPLASVPSNRMGSEAIVAACQRLIARRAEAGIAPVMVPQQAQQQQACAVSITWRNDNPDTIANRLAARLGREPTTAELCAEVKRILREARL